jgi:microsomal dipeptidase-like Zn-dependent dipeptidase
MANYFSDLHCHSALFPFNQFHESTWHQHLSLLYPSQGDFTKIAKGKVRVLLVSLYPIEKGFVTVKPLPHQTGDVTDALAQIIFDMPKERADEIQSKNHDYFEDLLKEYAFLLEFADPETHKVGVDSGKRTTFRYKIVSNFNDLKNILNLDGNLNPGDGCKDTIAVVLTIEGAHSLGIGQTNTLGKPEAELRIKLQNNIARLKNLGPAGNPGAHCPFFITLSHHFWNQLGGHSVSLWGIIRKAMDQNTGINEGISPLGEFAVRELLSKSPGVRRILIDSSHMSIKVRKWYYGFLKQWETNTGEKIPVIVSHSGVNGKKTIAESEMIGTPENIHDVADVLYKQSTEFNPWDVFLSDEEIMTVHQSGGIIGLNMDQRIMMGKKTLEETRKRARLKRKEVALRIWIEPLLKEIFHIAGHILSVTGNPAVIWDNICIGSDFDGMITPIPAYNNATKFPELNDTMFNEFLQRRGGEAVLAGKTDAEIQEITDKIMWKNIVKFLEKHY